MIWALQSRTGCFCCFWACNKDGTSGGSEWQNRVFALWSNSEKKKGPESHCFCQGQDPMTSLQSHLLALTTSQEFQYVYLQDNFAEPDDRFVPCPSGILLHVSIWVWNAFFILGKCPARQSFPKVINCIFSCVSACVCEVVCVHMSTGICGGGHWHWIPWEVVL